MKFNPPRRPWIGEEEFDLYQGVLRAGYPAGLSQAGLSQKSQSEELATPARQ